MYKVLIADDEAIERNASRLMLKKNFENIEIVAEAANGLEAIDMAIEHCPDIIIMDIKMPGIDGLRAIKEIKNVLPRAKFLVLTAYGNFQYAQRALKIGVEDFLLKPVKRQKLIETLNMVINKIRNEGLESQQAIELKAKIENLIPFIERDILSTIIAGGNASEIIQRYAGFLDVNLSVAFCIVIKVNEKFSDVSVHDNVEISLIKQKVYQAIVETVKGVCNCLVSELFNNYIILLVPVQKDYDKYRNKIWAIDLASYINSRVKGSNLIDLKFGIGGVHKGYSCLYDSYIEALNAVKFTDEQNTIIHYGDINIDQSSDNLYPFDIEQKLSEKILLGDKSASLALAVDILNILFEVWGNKINTIKGKIFELVVVISRSIRQQIPAIYEYAGVSDDLFVQINNIKDLNNLRTWTLKHIESLINLIEESKKNKINSVISAATKYIDENYNKDLALEDVAYKVGISSYYLSRLFKHELKKNFIDYITEQRINKAKELLKGTNMSIKEISYGVGFNNQTYFSKVFKKVTGLSPSEYKEC